MEYLGRVLCPSVQAVGFQVEYLGRAMWPSVQAVGFEVEYLGRAMWNVCSGRRFPGGVSGPCDVERLFRP